MVLWRLTSRILNPLAPARAAEPQKPVIRDPVLARAVDLIKVLAIVRESRP